LLKVQIWPRIGFGLCSFTLTFQELEQALHRHYYQILPIGGIICTTNVRSRTIGAGFFGTGLSHLGVKALIAMSYKLLMHYSYQIAIGWSMQPSYSLLFVELGLLFQPLQESYTQVKLLETHSWMKMHWEKLSKFVLKVVVADFNIAFPCNGDHFIMQVLIQLGYSNEMLYCLN
jgi:hypothetical protein